MSRAPNIFFPIPSNNIGSHDAVHQPTANNNAFSTGNDASINTTNKTGSFASCHFDDDNTTTVSAINETHLTVSCRTFRFRAPPALFNRSTAASPSSGLIVAVLSSADKYTMRQAIRTTWANRTPSDTLPQVFFVLAGNDTSWNQSQARDEFHRYHDLLWLDKADLYDELTYKTTAAIAILTTYYSPGFQYLLKTDDDSYVNLPLLSRNLHSTQQHHASVDYLGYCFLHQTPPIRPEIAQSHPRKAQFALSRRIYPEDWYPPYCSGAGYVLSHSLCRCTTREIPHVRYHPFEDVAVGLLAERCGVAVPTHNPHIARDPNKQQQQHLLSPHTTLIQHRVTKPELMQQLHTEAATTMAAATENTTTMTRTKKKGDHVGGLS